MMPDPVSEGLQPFFEQLAGLSAVNRAFAVHFGELRPTATRIADAKLAPTLPALTTETAPTRLASAEPSPTARSARRDRPATAKRKPPATARLRPRRTAPATPPTPAPVATATALGRAAGWDTGCQAESISGGGGTLNN